MSSTKTTLVLAQLAGLLLATNALHLYGASSGAALDGTEQGGHYDYYAEPHYSYEYKVHDEHTGDMKNQHETREGDLVKGYYMLKEADGTIREVHYTADKHNGFNAEVKRIGHAVHAPVYGHHQLHHHVDHHY